MNVLELLQQYLMRYQQPQADALDPMLEQIMRRETEEFSKLPPDLPDVVQSSIYSNPSYAEGQRIPWQRNPLMEQELPAFKGPQREDQLMQALGSARMSRDHGVPYPEQGFAAPGLDEYARGLNSLMRRAPGTPLY